MVWTGCGIQTGPALVEDAEDECILIFQAVHGQGVRHVSVDARNNVWVGGVTNRTFDLLEAETGRVLATFDEGVQNLGGYGGLMDGNGVLWSASRAAGGRRLHPAA